MDPFTQRMLERAKVRREKLESHFASDRETERKYVEDEGKVSDTKLICNNENLNGKSDRQDVSNVRKLKLQKLAMEYSSCNVEQLPRPEEPQATKVSPEKPKHRLGRLAELAIKINEWEDDINHKKYSSSKDVGKNKLKENEKPKMANPLMEKLCSQGFLQHGNKLMYDFESVTDLNKENVQNKRDEKDGKSIKTPHSYVKSTATVSASGQCPLLKKIPKIEDELTKSVNKSVKDPAELSLAERRALFERNEVVKTLPKNNHGQMACPENKAGYVGDAFSQTVCQKSTAIKQKIQNDNNEILNTVDVRFEQNKSVQDIDLSKNSDGNDLIKSVANNPVELTVAEERKSTSGLLSERCEKNDIADGDDARKGRLYPSLSSLDVSEVSEITAVSEMSSPNKSNESICHLNMSFGDLVEMNEKTATLQNNASFSNSKEFQVLNKMDKLLESALSDIPPETDEEVSPRPSKIMKSSNSEEKCNNSGSESLLHTLSFYRKQQQSSYCPPENNDVEQVSTEDQTLLAEKKIQLLLTEVNKQQTIISQASQALNLCLSTVEFSGSGEQVEGERLLLLATHKRQACLNEIQRLKIEKNLQPQGKDLLSQRGDVTLSNISVKLKRDALRAMAAVENLEYFVCLIKSDEQVLATPVVPAIRENLTNLNLQFPGSIKLESLLSNFRVCIEVYSLELNKELLPHDIKYHISNKKDKKLLTPIKSKKTESKLVKPNIQSPAGPNAVRTTNFRMCGYIMFSLREVTRTQWMLNKVPYVSSLEGSLSMAIHSQLRFDDEFRGFLTMFDDISGFGAWHRRWCLLSSHIISFWKYPDDEQKKVPIGTIDLKSVATENVGLVSHDICARLNTFLLETTRPSLSEDKDSLVLKVEDNVTTIRHLLSADSKQEMLTWCKKLNTILALLRSWKCNSDG